MTDPRRLMAGGDGTADLGSGELARWLIDSARHEEPGTHALQRTLLGVGATGAVLAATASASAVSSSAAASGAGSAAALSGTAGAATVSGASAVTTGAATAAATSAAVGTGAVASGAAVTAKAAGLSVLGAAGKGAALKWLAVSLVGGATLVGASSKLIAPTPEAASTPQAAPAAQAVPRIAQPSVPSFDPQHASEDPGAALTPGNAATPARKPAVSAATTDPQVIEATALRKEVQLIDRAREAKEAGQHSRVVALSQEYLASFPRGRLLPEAISLKMESETALGRSQQAAQTAKMLLRIAPNSPQAKRAHELSSPTSPTPP